MIHRFSSVMSTVQCKLTYLSEKAAENVCVPHFDVDVSVGKMQNVHRVNADRDLLAT